MAVVAVRPTWTTRRQAWGLFVRGATVRVASRVAVIVGTVLSVANQGAILIGEDPSWATWVRVAVNYLTPFVVASLGYLAGCRIEPGQADGSNLGED